MKPNQPRVVSSSRNYITVDWIPCALDETSWYILDRKDEILGWCRAYTGFKTQTEIGPLAPGNYYKFRLKIKSENEESEWSDTLFAITKDDVIPASYLHRVVENGPVTNLRKILAQHPPIDIPNKQGLTPLRLAILKNSINFMGILLTHGADIGNTETGSGRTPLMMAAQRGFLEAVQLLLEKGSSWETRDRNGLTAFNYAVDNSHLPIVQLAIEEGVDLKIKDRFGWNPLMRGVILKSSLDILTHLLNSGCDVNESDDRNQTILMQAVLSERAEVVELLLKAGANINARNIYGHTAYDFAKHSTNEDIMKMAHLLAKNSEETSKNKGTSKERSLEIQPEKKSKNREVITKGASTENNTKGKKQEKGPSGQISPFNLTYDVSNPERKNLFGTGTTLSRPRATENYLSVWVHSSFSRHTFITNMGRITYERIDGEEGEKLDELFGIKDCLIQVNPGKVILPPDFKAIGERIIDLKVREDDVWLVSYPRTGSTWAQEMIWCIGNNLDFEKAKQLQQLRTPLLELTAIMAHHHGDWMKELGNSVDLVEKLSSPRFIKSHLPWELLPKELEVVQPKVVYVARNPKDMCVSYYHYCLLVHNMKGSFEDFCELFLKDKAPVGPIWNHILGFWNRRHQKNILFLKYEEMKKDQIGAIRKAAEFMNKNLSEEDIQKLADHLSFNKMKQNPAVNLEPLIAKKEGPEFLKNSDLRFIRKGEIGDHKNFMTDDLIARFDKWTEENLRGTGLSFE